MQLKGCRESYLGVTTSSSDAQTASSVLVSSLVLSNIRVQEEPVLLHACLPPDISKVILYNWMGCVARSDCAARFLLLCCCRVLSYPINTIALNLYKSRHSE